MAILPNWRDVLTRAWSIKFILLAAALSGSEVVFTVLTPELLGVPPGLFAALAGLASAAALVFRLLAQPGITPPNPTPEEPK